MRELTGEWYLKKGLFGYQIMVEVEITSKCSYDYSGDMEYRRFEKATDADIIELGITTV